MSEEESVETPGAEETLETPEAPQASPSAERKRHLRKSLVGVVISDKMQKTIVVNVERRVPHPQFKKIVRLSKRFYAHDENEEAEVGDKVRIVETRPISKKKCWRLDEVLAH